jgi:hypothetical protein
MTTYETTITWTDGSGLTAEYTQVSAKETRIMEILLKNKDGSPCLLKYEGKAAYVGCHPVIIQDGVMILYKSWPNTANIAEVSIELEDTTLTPIEECTSICS